MAMKYVICVLALLLFLPAVHAQTVPTEISDAEFWKIITDFSEADGEFSSDNFLSNENTFQRVIPTLRSRIQPGGVYIGVGPEQNFTYISALHPSIAFIVDIRRQNMLQHLMYKAAFDLSETRADFLSLIFSRERPGGLSVDTPVEELFRAFENKTKTWDNERYRRNLDAIMANLTVTHRFSLTSKDKETLSHIFHAFQDAGTGLSYGYQVPGGVTPTYAQLMAETDGQGTNWSYLSTEENFRAVKEMERRNLIIPIVGDFAGHKALLSVGRYIQEHGATINVFYTSNVERYLFDDSKWSDFYQTVGKLPLDSTSTFIRAILTPRRTRGAAIRTSTYLSTIAGTLNAYRAGRLSMYEQLVIFSQ